MMENIFTVILNMSITASVVTVFITIFRWVFGKKLPAVFNYTLWAIVLLRLIVPVFLPSVFSIFNVIQITETIATQTRESNESVGDIPDVNTPHENTVSDVLSNNVKDSLPDAIPEASADPAQVLIFAMSLIWIAGSAGLFLFSMFLYFHASQKFQEAVLFNNNNLISRCSRKLKLSRKVQIHISDRIHTPVVYGLIKTRIIIPLDLKQNCSERELEHIIIHELVHIKRFDYIIKPLSIVALCIHWFNPVIWFGFILSQKDMEMSCDEKVMSVFDKDIRKEYASSLIKLAANQNVLLNGGLMAFGESNIKVRIKEIMNFKKFGFWIGAVTTIILIIFGLLLLTNGQSGAVNKNLKNKNSVNSEGIIKGNNIESKDTVLYNSDDVSELVEKNLTVIMSSPLESSNPQNYIDAHQSEYEAILKFGGEDALWYMLSQFEAGSANGLREQIMMRLCKRILGARNNVTNDSLSAREWYNALSIRQEIKLPDFAYDGNDPIEKLVYATEMEQKTTDRGFTVIALKIFGSYEKDDMLKVFVTTYCSSYKLYDNELDQVSGSVVPAAITYKKNDDGSYVLKEYIQARDGAEFAPSIREYCTMPISGEKIPGLPDKILKHYGKYDGLRNLMWKNLYKHLRVNGFMDATLKNSRGEIQFSMKNTKF